MKLNRLKNKKWIAIAIIVCSMSALNVSTALKTEKSDQSLSVFLNALVYGEGGGSIDNPRECVTGANSDVMYQKCGDIETPIRIEITYYCDGNLPGMCYTGAEYYYFDCDGSVISEQDKKEVSFCK